MLNDIVGQDEGVRCLRRVVSGDLCKPLLLVGDEGVGRKASALSAVQEIVGAHKGDSAVLQVRKGVHPDVYLLEPLAGKELAVEAVREAILQATQYPVSAPCRFFIVDGADRMSTAAANAILKTLEEPAELTRFFLLAESYDQVLPTIRSRCGRVDYRPLPEDFIFRRLSSFELNQHLAWAYTRLSEGSVGRAIRYWSTNRVSVRDRCVEMVRQAASGDLPTAFAIVDSLAKDLRFGLRMLLFVVHDLLLLPSAPERIASVDLRDDLTELYKVRPFGTWVDFWASLRRVWVRSESTYVNLPLQVKSVLTSFVV